jgi:hypothetical protein
VKRRAAIVVLAWAVIGVARWTNGQGRTNGQGQPAPAAAAAEKIDDSRVGAAGIRKLAGKHLVLYTDLPSRPEIDSLPELFDRAVPLWAAYFGVDPAKTQDWQVRAFLIGDRARFAALGLMPADNELVHGYSQGSDLWLFDQPSDYYRRHLLLHEGTHAFMTAYLGGCGPGWYSEGTAELLATHRWRPAEAGKLPDQPLTLGVMPPSREEMPMWGRIKLIREAVAAGRVRTLTDVMTIDNRRQLADEEYAWCWAAAKFLDSHPRYQQRFRDMQRHVRDPDFNEQLKRALAADWRELSSEWQAYASALDYGYDFKRMAIEFERGTPLAGKPREVTIAADRGWQSSGVKVDAGKTYRIAARGRYQIAVERIGSDVRPWPCEPGGVTIEYHDGRPLGMLLGAIVPDEGDAVGFLRPLAIGLAAEITSERGGTLYFRVNDSAARLDDNRGALTIRIAE